MLLEQTKCNKFFYSSEMQPTILELQSQFAELRIEALAPLDDWLAGSTTPFPYEKTLEESKWDPIVVLHSSGSTGQYRLRFS